MANPMAVLLLAVLALLAAGGNAQLSSTFYQKSCPNAAAIIKQAVLDQFNRDQFEVPSVLRLCFHDALAGNGIDGGILITGSKSEQVAEGNTDLAINGFDAIANIKAAVEAKCKGVVSCSDILAQACRDVVVLAGGPTWDIRFGRRDTRVALASNVHLPGGDTNLDQIIADFKKVGLTAHDVVTLSGAHTVGFAHCHSLVKRLYNFNSTVKTDPALDPSLAQQLKDTCPQKNFDQDVVVPLDPNSVFKFDRIFYKNLRVGQGVLASDQILASDSRTKGLVKKYSKNTKTFFTAFADAMVRMSEANVLTGTKGEVRLVCSKINK